jgi:hypothetical protein
MINESIRHIRCLDLEALHIGGSYGRVEAGISDSICSTLDDEDTGAEERVDEKNVHTQVYHSIIQSKTYLSTASPCQREFISQARESI